MNLEQIAIIGLGLIGGSLGMALRAAALKDIEIVGYDRDQSVVATAQKTGAIDRGTRKTEEAVKEASVVIVSTPVLAIQRVFSDIAPHLREGAIVTDTGSTKGAIQRWAKELLPEHINFVGGHPMAGKETQGIAAADADLFRDKAYCISPAVGASEDAVRAVLGIVHTVGARPVFVDGDEHDSYVAAISHVPLVLSTALFRLARSSAAWPELASLASSGFRDTTRLASGEPEMSHDICITNRQNLVHWLDRYIREISELRNLIDNQADEDIFKAFATAQLDRETYLSGKDTGRDMRVAVDLPSTSDAMLAMVIGEYWVRRSNEMVRSSEKRMEDRERERRLKREDR
jgi:prephenate dehydrogenase